MIRWTDSAFSMLAPLALSLTSGIVGCSSAASTAAPHSVPAHDSGTAVSHPLPDASASSAGDASAKKAAAAAPITYAGSEALAAPGSDTGWQIETPDYDANDANSKQLIVQPGQEIFLCYYKTLPKAGETDVGAFQSWMSPNSSHHFIVYYVGGGGGGFLGGSPQPDGTVNSCGLGAGGTWVYATSTPGEVVGMKMPDGVGLPFAAGTQLMLNMHFINPGSTALYPKVKLNVLYAQNVQQKAAVMISFNTKINIPAATSSGPGTQTVSGTCSAPAGSQFFIMSTHTHKHATAAVVNFISGGVTQEIVHTGMADTYPSDQRPGSGTDWEHPGVGEWTAPSFLTVNSGDSFTYSCTYSNTAATAVTVGETAASNEMCMAIGYYFPAGTARCQ
jgi:Copper type II ascorbate-dependent monooxygenase, C-terminal domain